MPGTDHLRRAAPIVAAVGLLAGCGSGRAGGSTATSSAPATASTAGPSSSSATTSGSPSSPSSPAAGALSADARSAGTGDIPDNQVFLTYASHHGGFAIKYPEGWTQSGSARNVNFKDKNNVVHIVIAPGPAPTAARVISQLQGLKRAQPSLRFTAPQPVPVAAGTALRARYTTRSALNPVTGKQVTLVVDRYVLGSRGRVAVVDLGTPVGVDNVDAYRMMIRSFRWR
jgi:hypothetical protein